MIYLYIYDYMDLEFKGAKKFTRPYGFKGIGIKGARTSFSAFSG